MQIFDADGQLCLFDQGGSAGKTSPAPSAVEHRNMKISGSSLRKSQELYAIPYMSLDLTPGHGDLLGKPFWELLSPWRGGSSTLNTGPAPLSADGASTLSQILEDSPHRKYYLTRKACLGILRRSEQRGKPLPPQLKLALMMQAGLIPCGIFPAPPLAFHINQREETIDLGGVAGALMATSNMQMQTFITEQECGMSRETPETDMRSFRKGMGMIAGFSAGAGASAGSIAYSEHVSPTLKGSPGGNSMPAILCLNDQGGDVMEHTEGISGTLRAEMHGHQPLVFDNHGIDSRYTGPHSVVPTLSASAGTGGNNLPLVEQEQISDDDAGDHPALYSRQRVDKFRTGAAASTESARQCKDATDVILTNDSELTGMPVPEIDWSNIDNQFAVLDKDGNILFPLLVRRLTPLECERLQGFPDGWTDIPGASDSVRYRALGNSVAIPCVEFVMSGIAMAAGHEG